MATNYRQTGSPGYLFSIVLVAVIGGLLFGYDTAVVNGAGPSFKAFFQNEGANEWYTELLHGNVMSSALLGCVIGALLSGLLASRIGRKRSLFVAGILFFLSALGSYYPEFLFFQEGIPTKGLLWAFVGYRVLGGIGVGLASAICPMYIAEIAPASKRGSLVSWNQFAIIFGQLVVYFVSALIMRNHTDVIFDKVTKIIANATDAGWAISSGWRYMFVSECVPAALFALLILLVPETPRYLVLSGKDEKALQVLSKVNGEAKGREVLADIKATISEHKDHLLTYGFLVIFIGCMLSVFQQAIGINAVLYYSTDIFRSVGMTNPMLTTVIMGVINIIFTLFAIFTVERIGRKPLLVSGSVIMAVGALCVAVGQSVSGLSPYVTVAGIMVYSAAFMFSWGPICWVYISELFPNTIRSQATAIAVAFQWIFNYIVSSTFPAMFGMSAGSMGESFGHFFSYALYGLICIVAAIFVWRLVPETKGKTLEDMTALWREKSKK